MRKKANNYLKLLNPFTTLAHTGEGDIAPTGKFALSRDPKTNLALWNTIGVSSWAIPLAIAANVASNRYWKKEIEKARKKRTVSKLEALRPRLSPDSDLDDISNIVDTPEEENRLIEEIEKKASDVLFADEANDQPGQDEGEVVGGGVVCGAGSGGPDPQVTGAGTHRSDQ